LGFTEHVAYALRSDSRFLEAQSKPGGEIKDCCDHKEGANPGPIGEGFEQAADKSTKKIGSERFTAE
jgi:hypothetical protein